MDKNLKMSIEGTKAIDNHRLNWIDLARGVAILLVVIGHTFRDDMLSVSNLSYIIKNVIYTFHLPLFFLLSGYVFKMTFKKRNFSQFFSKKVKSMLIPFISYTLLLYIIFHVAFKVPIIGRILEGASFTPVSLINYLYNSLLYRNPYSFHLWYIWILFLVQIFIFAIEIVFEKFENKEMKIALVALLLKLVDLNFDVEFYMLSLFMHYLIYFVAGELIFKYSERILNSKKMLTIGIVAFLVMLVYLSNGWDIDSFKNYSLILYNVVKLATVILSILPMLGVMIISYNIHNIKLLSYLGKKSFVIYLLHQPFFSAFVGVVLYNKLHLPILFTCVICIITAIVFPLLLEYSVNKHKKLSKITKLLFNVGKC